jgi:hypothetical protein
LYLEIIIGDFPKLTLLIAGVIISGLGAIIGLITIKGRKGNNPVRTAYYSHTGTDAAAGHGRF